MLSWFPYSPLYRPDSARSILIIPREARESKSGTTGALPGIRGSSDGSARGAGSTAAGRTGPLSARSASPSRPGTAATSLPVGHPGRERTAWMLGTVKGEVACFREIPEYNGPAQFNYTMDKVLPVPPRHAITSTRRFGPMTSGDPSAPEPVENFGRATPGPKYDVETSAAELRRPAPPRHSFGSKGAPSRRSGFINASIKGGYIYHARPAHLQAVSTARPRTRGGAEEGGAAVRAAQPAAGGPVKDGEGPDQRGGNIADGTGELNCYSVAAAKPRFPWSKSIRTVYLAKTVSPGPIYYSHEHELSRDRRHAVVQPGKWCP